MERVGWYIWSSHFLHAFKEPDRTFLEPDAFFGTGPCFLRTGQEQWRHVYVWFQSVANLILNFDSVREDAHKKKCFFVVGPLRDRGGGVNPLNKFKQKLKIKIWWNPGIFGLVQILKILSECTKPRVQFRGFSVRRN